MQRGAPDLRCQFDLESTLIFLGVLIPSIILHEISHGLVAYWCGDDTAKRAGRLTLNPVPHIDPFGSIILPLLLSLTSFGVFGFAKPVPVNVGRCGLPATRPCWYLSPARRRTS